MKQQLTKWENFRARLAVWIVVNIASRISSLAVLALCKDIYESYLDHIEVAGE